MSGTLDLATVVPVSPRELGSDSPPKVLVVGGGVAGLEVLVGLRTLAGDRVELELVSPERYFAHRPLLVGSAFGAGPGPVLEVGDVARTVNARCTIDAVSEVVPQDNLVALATGASRGYDILVIATGARPTDCIPGAIAFGAPGGSQRFRNMLAEAQRGVISRIVFAVPDQAGWPLPLYELALVTADRLQAVGASAEITLLTHEPAPLALFGARASDAVLDELETRGIHFIAGTHADQFAGGELRAWPGDARIRADAVVTLPMLRGLEIPGLPADEQGFLPVDAHGLVHGLTDVYAAGDAVSFPVKHGSLAAGQADAVAEAIAARVGAAVKAEPFRGVLRGLLLAGKGSHYLESAMEGSTGGPGVVSSSPLWWPPAKIAGRYLAPYLSGQISSPPAMPSGRGMQLEIDLDRGPVPPVGVAGT